MKENILDVLKKRGVIHSIVYEDELRKKLENPTTFYMGFDPTGPSLTLGHFVAILMIARMQRAGHKPLVLVGGATALIGDPSFRNDMRPLLTREQIKDNMAKIQKQFETVVNFKDGSNKAEMVNNGDWLEKLSYIDFIREIGGIMSINKMLACDCFKTRMETGLSFLELNYMPMQAYDFWHLFKEKGCSLEIGGSDQWANILAGVDLIRRKEGKDAFAFASNLLLTSDGKKMGKTEKGAIFLSAEKTSPYEMYQYLRSVNDADVKNCLNLLTFLSDEEIESLTSKGGAELNKAKEILAYETTKLVHGQALAAEAQNKAKSAFSGGSDVPESSYETKNGELIIDVLVGCGFASSRGDAKKLILGGGVKCAGENISDIGAIINTKEKFVILQKGKKNFIKINVKGGK